MPHHATSLGDRYTQTHTHTQTHVHADTQTQTHKHTHTHTHTDIVDKGKFKKPGLQLPLAWFKIFKILLVTLPNTV